jgi:hypothetical protein
VYDMLYNIQINGGVGVFIAIQNVKFSNKKLINFVPS